MIVRFALRNVQRNVRRSLLTILTVTLGCILLTIGLSWLSGVYYSFVNSSIQNGGLVRISTETYYQKEALNPLEENIVHTAPIVERLLQLEEVTAVYPRISQGVAASIGGEELGEIFGLLTGADIEYYRDVLKLEDKIHKGSFFTENAEKEGLIGRSLAKDMDVTVGDDAIFVGQTQDGSISPIKITVVGILDTGNSVFDRCAYVHIEKARWMADIPEGSTELLIFGPTDAATTSRTIQEISSDFSQISDTIDQDGKPVPLSILAWNKREPFASMIILPQLISGLLAAIIIFITALGVLNTMMMSVLERTAEIGILRALGMQRTTVAATFILEAMTIAVFGGLAGSFIGSLLSIWMADKGINLGEAAANSPDSLPINTTLYPEWSPELALFTFLLSLLMAFLGSAIPAIQANRITPVEAIRTKH